MDGRQIVDALEAAGYHAHRPEAVVELIFGSGMAPAWREGETSVRFGRKHITPHILAKTGDSFERLFFVPAHRSILISDGWASPFQKLTSDMPAVARLFSQALFDQFRRKDAGTLFPVEHRLQPEIRSQINDAIYHGGFVGIEEDSQRAMRLRLMHGGLHLPFTTWSAGQREFTPLLLGLYPLLPLANSRRHPSTEWIVIEEPEMGLHPQGVSAALLMVLDLLSRGYRVVLSTHSPHILTMLWMMRHLKQNDASWQSVCDAFSVDQSRSMQRIAEAALCKDYRAYLMDFDSHHRVNSFDISKLDPGSVDPRISGWGGLTEYSSRFGESVRAAVNMG